MNMKLELLKFFSCHPKSFPATSSNICIWFIKYTGWDRACWKKIENRLTIINIDDT